jgi:hypothetical protein
MTNNVFHPDYGYPDQLRLKVCKTAIKHGKKYAAKKHNVSITSIYIWIKVFSFDAIMREV